jgi:hypothetical protein
MPGLFSKVGKQIMLNKKVQTEAESPKGKRLLAQGFT